MYKPFQQTAFLLFLFLSFSCNSGNYYSVTAEFDQVDGLYEKARVQISGLQIGYVKDIQLIENKIYVTLHINTGNKISDKAIFVIKNADLLGTKFIDIQNAEGSGNYLAEGDKIKGAFDGEQISTPMNMDSLVLNVAKPILDSLGYDVVSKKKSN